ncbi:LamG-like jellyroll fold domain-containing protein [Algoriphagus sp.]|uniref:LamG-like jellyroll fold domain-containing protein n=1 Tax=Algoriphagus sp. TaxID=1872435 RepID=UPI00261B0DBA|nr:LamG-like jellyroll fold domain-containing protein [Algoriphagus sp.]
MKLKLLYLLSFILASSSFKVQAQLSDLHYLPPLKQATNEVAIIDQALYLSTPETTPFDIEIFRGSSSTPYATISISNVSPGLYTLPNGDNDITLVSDANTGIVLSNSGLRLQSKGGQKFYANFRGKNSAQGTSLTSKGRQALGTSFKWGGLPLGYSNSTGVNATLGIMATEDGTVVNVFGYDPDVAFRAQANGFGMTDDTKQIILNAGESFVFEVKADGTAVQRDGWLGASITSNKKIAISNGSLLLRGIDDVSIGGWDAGIDQPSPENIIGKEYVFVRGRGMDIQEYPVIIATQNGTDIFVNGSSTPFASLNAGDYIKIPASFYSVNVGGGNMFVSSNKDIYAYQVMSGDTQIATGGLNFISPVNCLMFTSIDNVPFINNLAGTTISGGVTIIASTSIPDNEIIISYESVVKSAADFTVRNVPGTDQWKTIYAEGLTGNVKVEASGPIAVGYVGVSGLIGVAGYYSGLDNVPNLVVQLVGDGCLPGTILQATEGFSSYAWFNEGVLIPGETANTFTPEFPGSYSVEVSMGPCIYESAPQIVVNCNPEIVLSNLADISSGKPDETITFTIKAKYIGEEILTDLVVNNVIPEGLTLSTATPSFGTWTGSGQNYNWNIGTMYNGEEHILKVVTTVDNISGSRQVTYTTSNTQTQIDGNTLVDDPTETVLLYIDPLPEISSFGDINKLLFDGSFELKSPKSNSTGTFSYSSDNSSVATVSGNIVTITGIGTATITATQAAAAGYDQSFITAKLRVNATEALLTNYGERTTSKINFVNPNGALSSRKGIGAGGKLVDTKSPISNDMDLVLWLDAETKSSYNRLDNTWYDLSGNFNNGSLNNNFNYSISNSNSFVFNGNNNFVDFEEGFPSTDHLSIEAWVFPTSFAGSYSSIFSHDNWDLGMVRLQFSGSLLNMEINGANSVNSTYSFTPGQWYHVVAVYSKTAQSIRFYVNGELTNEASTGTNSPSIVKVPFSIGSLYGASNFLKGNMGIIKIYTRALEATAVSENFERDKGRFGF